MLTLRRSARPTLVLAAFALLAGLTAARPAAACPLCMNSDPALNNPGSTNSNTGQWRVTVENKSLSKLNGILQSGNVGTDHEFQHEDRLTTTFAYQPTMRLGLAASVPFMFRNHVQYSTISPPVKTTANNFSDADIQARYTFWIHHPAGKYASASVMGGVVVPTGVNSVLFPGTSQRLSEHNQPGTGAFSLLAGLSAQAQNANQWIYVGNIFKQVFQNDYDYNYGHAYMATVEVGQKATSKVALLGTAVYRWTKQEDGPLSAIYQVQTGGDIILVGGGVQATPVNHFMVRGLAYFPVKNGFIQPQSEDNSLSVSVSYIH